MNSYIDIQILPDPEFTQPLLMSVLFAKLHRALVGLESRDIGVSFPRFELEPRTLGSVMRIHGMSVGISRLMEAQWLKGMSDHVRLVDILDVPSSANHRVVRRVQPTTNAERIRRRRIKRHQISEERARELIPDSVEENVSLPYVMIRSQSTGHKFCLFIEHMPIRDEPVEGQFSTYGLSSSATIPWF